MKKTLLFSALLTMNTHAAVTEPAAQAINGLGIDLHRRLLKPEANLCLSPYSIQSAMAMTYAGADGATRAEMAKVLHFPEGDGIHRSFAALNSALADMSAKTARAAQDARKWGGPSEPIVLNVANRLYGQSGYAFRLPFLTLLNGTYHAPMEMVDFHKAAEPARKRINAWVEEQTKRRIRDLLPEGVLQEDSRLVLVNAVYLKAPWADEFGEAATRPEPFHVNGGAPKPLPTMRSTRDCGFAEHKGFRAVSIPYAGRELQFLVLVPEKVDGLAEVERGLDAATLVGLARMPQREVDLNLPKFRIEAPGVELSEVLIAMGMRTAFDQPPMSADFSRIAPRRPDDYLRLSKVMHKTFLALDEKGTEAAAATAVVVAAAGAAFEPPKPVVVKVDRPFFFAIQHVPSGACLFLGRVTDPAGK